MSALEHILGEEKTIGPDQGLFLAETWRLHPSISGFTSEQFYERRLGSRPELALQTIVGPTNFAGSGLWFVPVEHEGNQSSSLEEVEVVSRVVDEILVDGVEWVNSKSVPQPLTLEDILIVAPYNAQVADIGERIPGARIGTVDKFQGQEAPIVIYSTTTSSPEEAPRGMEFLYSLNRLNVATSRARCACILVASPALFHPDCRTPRQMELANAFCRYLEMAHVVNLTEPDS
ncbi:MAG: DEAD/DEAH box helicase [Acidobacteriota bacterium]